MKLVGLSREGYSVILVLSLIVLVLGDLFMYHRFEISLETGPFLLLIMLCLVRLFRREGGRRQDLSLAFRTLFSLDLLFVH
jgi:hypothetical protein